MKSAIKEKAIEMRKQGISIIKIGQELGVAKSSVSVWTRGITLTEEQRYALDHRECSDERALAQSNTFRIRRLQFQDAGRKRITKNDPLYIAGCMLYWGEGTKSLNQCRMVNSELPMLKIFKDFLVKFFNVSDDNFTIAINAYTDFHSQKEIENYWLRGLKLPRQALKKSTWNQYPSSSKKKSNKLEYGTCSLQICSTEIIQEIFGAIQEFGNFTNEKWLG